MDHKAKQVDVELSSGESLKFVCKDSVDAVYKKIDSSRSLANGMSTNNMDSERMSIDSRVIASPYAPRAVDAVGPSKSVHFAPSTLEIPPRADTPSDEGLERNGDVDTEGETAVALYDFTGDAGDELSIKEGEPLLVLDRTNDDWWKCRNHAGREGVVPAQYVDLEIAEPSQESPAQSSHAAAASAAAAAAARVKAPASPVESDHDSEEERQREQEREEKAAKERKEKERRKRDEQRKQQEQEAQLEAEREAKAAEQERTAKERKRAQEKKDRAAEQARLQKKQQETAAQKNKASR